MPTKNKFKDSKAFWIMFWITIIIIILGIGGAITNSDKKIASPSNSTQPVNKNFEVDDEYAKNLCVKESNFPDLDWSQNELVSNNGKYTVSEENKTKNRLASDESIPVHYYAWFSWSNVYSKNRAMHCHFITDMNTQESTIIWLWYADLEHQGGVHNVIGSQEKFLNLIK